MTYRKIAELAGVSVSTVSKVFSGSPEIGRDTYDRVMSIAAEHGVSSPKYHRDRVGVRVAVIVPEINSISYSMMVTQLAEELEARGIIPCVYITNFDNKKFSRIVDSVTDSLMDGIISLVGYPYDNHFALPTVWFTSRYGGHGVTIDTDYSSAIFEAVEYLAKLGHTDIGFVGERLTLRKLEHFKKAMLGLGLPVNEKLIYTSTKRFETIGYEAVNYYTNRHILPTAVLCAYDEVAMGMIHAFRYKGIVVPDDISIIGINDIPFASYAETPLTTISTLDSNAAHIAVEILCEQIADPGTIKPRHIELKGELIIRNTTSKPREKVDYYKK